MEADFFNTEITEHHGEATENRYSTHRIKCV
jgi:hypothetical protein